MFQGVGALGRRAALIDRATPEHPAAHIHCYDKGTTGIHHIRAAGEPRHGSGCVIRDDTIWLTQKAMGALFGVERPAITKHLTNIFNEGELDEKVVCSILELTTQHGALDGKTQTRQTKVYNLDAIISVGYRVNSRQATMFRQWATKVLNEYIRKGFALDDRRLKQGAEVFGRDYFRELLERVRSIRASERRIWQQITDIYAECSTDYDRNAPTIRDFYAMVQNRFHYAITGQTAAEIVYSSADHTKPHMGLRT